MRRIRPYYFCKLKREGFLAVYERVVQLEGILCFDLEDSIGDSDKNRAHVLKSEQRRSVIAFLKSIENRIEQPDIGLRINSCTSEYYPDDLRALNSLRSLQCVFLPKVESGADMESFSENVESGVAELIPVVETVRGFDYLSDILSVNDWRFTSLAFGHCDFNLDNGFFPFHHQNSLKYWEWIDALDSALLPSGKRLLNSPVLRLGDTGLFAQVLSKFRRYGSAGGQVTLCFDQTRMCSSYEDVSPLPFGRACGSVDPSEKACRVVHSFENYRGEGKWFALDKDRTIVSVQEYTAAKRFLKRTAIA